MVELLLHARADPELRRSDSEAASHGNRSVDLRESQGSPPLHDAVRLADAGIVELLLRPKAANGIREQGDLSFAEASRRSELPQFLLRGGLALKGKEYCLLGDCLPGTLGAGAKRWLAT